MAKDNLALVRELAGTCKEEAARYSVIPDVHPEDFIFHFLIQNPCFREVKDAVKYYFCDGSRSAQKLRDLIADLFGSSDSAIRLLEFASGYGCVTRHFSDIIPKVDATSCDIHMDAVNFIKNNLGKPAILSHAVPEHLNTPKEYDIIFALSFFSHMPQSTWSRWLNALISKLKNGGYLIFTTHGMESRKHFNYPQLGSEGFWFSKQSEQGDLDTSEYGQTIVLPKFVFHQIREEGEARFILFREAYWWEHQDLYVVKKL